MIADVSGRLIGQFADRLSSTMLAAAPAPEPQSLDLIAASGARRLVPSTFAGLGVIVIVAVLVWVLS